MFITIVLICSHVAAFVAGALVFRNNKAKAEAVVAKAEDLKAKP